MASVEHQQNENRRNDVQATSNSPLGSGDNNGNSNLRQRLVGQGENSGQLPAQQEPPAPEPQLLPAGGRRRLRQETEQFLSLVNTNPVTCICILLTSAVVLIGVGYFMYDMHLTYKYSSIIQKLHATHGFGEPVTASKSSHRLGRSASSKSSFSTPTGDIDNSGTPSNLEVKKPSMLDPETELYASQLQSVLSNLKRTINRIQDSKTNSSTLVAGLVELKPLDKSKKQQPSESESTMSNEYDFTTETNSDSNSAPATTTQRPNIGFDDDDDDDDLLELLRKAVESNIEDNKKEPLEEKKAKPNPLQSFPDYLQGVKKSVTEESIKAEEKLNEWIVKHRPEYSNDEEWNEALAKKKAKEEDYTKFLETLFKVTEEMETSFNNDGNPLETEETSSSSGIDGGGEVSHHDKSVPIDKLVKKYNTQQQQQSKPSLDDIDEDDISSDDIASVKKFIETELIGKKIYRIRDGDGEWVYDPNNQNQEFDDYEDEELAWKDDDNDEDEHQNGPQFG